MAYIPKKDQEYLEVLREKTAGMTSEEKAQYFMNEFPESTEGLENTLSYESLRGQRIAVRDVQRFF